MVGGCAEDGRRARLAGRTEHRRVDYAGADSVDALRGELGGDRAAQLLDAGADGGQGGLRSLRPLGRRSGHQHDGAVVGEVRRAVADHVGVAPELLEAALEAGHVHLEEWPQRAVASGGGGDQDGERRLLREERLQGILVAHIALGGSDALDSGRLRWVLRGGERSRTWAQSLRTADRASAPAGHALAAHPRDDDNFSSQVAQLAGSGEADA